MLIAVLGSGPVGRAVAGRLAGLGHDVVLGTRDPETTSARPDVAGWHEENSAVSLATFANAADGSEIVVNAVSGAISLEVLEAAGERNLRNTVLVDISNPLQPGSGFPPQLFVKDDDSLAEQIQRRWPAARVVKTLNTMNNQVMINPGVLEGPSSVFVSGDDPSAKRTVTALLEQMGHQDVIDLGDLSTARGAEDSTWPSGSASRWRSERPSSTSRSSAEPGRSQPKDYHRAALAPGRGTSTCHGRFAAPQLNGEWPRDACRPIGS